MRKTKKSPFTRTKKVAYAIPYTQVTSFSAIYHQHDYFAGKNESSQKCLSSSGADELRTFPAFERYGNVSSSLDKAILDNFAIQLLRNKELQGYVVVYVGPGARSNAGQRRIRSIKRYLTNVRGIPAKRVISKQGERRSEAGAELYLLPHDALKPGAKTDRTLP